MRRLLSFFSDHRWLLLAILMVIGSFLIIGCQGSLPESSDDEDVEEAPAEDIVEPGSEDELEEIPNFPWPPPKASAMAVLPERFFSGAEKLGDVETSLVAALEAGGYFERSYYRVPRGFAMVSRLEQIEADGRPAENPDRWSIKPARQGKFSLRTYLKALFNARPGFFRLIVFTVTPEPFRQAEEGISREAAIQLLSEGANTLPKTLAELPFTTATEVTALIYEFQQTSGGEPTLLVPSRLTSREHLQKAEIWTSLEN